MLLYLEDAAIALLLAILLVGVPVASVVLLGFLH
jgi:hypothetical protein